MAVIITYRRLPVLLCICICICITYVLPAASANVAVAESGRVKVIAVPSNSLVVNSSVVLSCMYDYSNETDTIVSAIGSGAASMNLLLGGVYCFSDCSRRGKRCGALQTVDCSVALDEAKRLWNVSYIVSNVDAGLDSKRISCSFSTSSAGITLFIRSPPRMIDPPVNTINRTSIIAGRPFVVNCSFAAQELRTVTWYRAQHALMLISPDNETLQATEVRAVGLTGQLSQLSQQNSWLSTLTVAESQLADAADYRCEAESPYGTALSSPMQVDVLAPIGAARLIAIADSDVRVNLTQFVEGANATLRCSLQNGSAPFTVRVYENRTSSSMVTLHYEAVDSNASEHAVTLTLDRQHNLAAFFCIASNLATRELGADVISPSISLVVAFAPDASVRPIVTGFPQFLAEGNDGVAVNVTCSFSSVSIPSVELSWLRNGQPVSQGVSSLFNLSAAPVTSALSIAPDALKRTNNRDAYYCQAFYDGRAVAASDTHALMVKFPANPLAMQPRTADDRVLRLAGETLSLQCVANDSNPQTTIRWTVLDRNGSPLLNQSRLAVRTETFSNGYGGVSTISTGEFDRPTAADNDLKFVCSFERDGFASGRLEATLVVLELPEIEIVASTRDIEEGDNVTLECRTRGGNPSDSSQFNYTWSFNGAPLKSRDSNSLYGYGRVLKLLNIGSHHIGRYECRAESIAGFVIAQHNLDLKYAVRCVRDCELLHWMPLGRDYFLQFVIASNPLPTGIRWYRIPNNFSHSDLYADSLLSSTLDLALTCSDRCSSNFSFGARNTEVVLLVRNVTEADFGTYICIVEHELGARNFTFDVVPYIPGAVNEVFRSLPADLVLILSSVIAGCVALTIAIALGLVLRRRAKAARRRKSTFEGEENDAENELDLPACSTLRFQDDLTKAGFRKASNIFENFVPTYQSVQTCSSASDSAIGSMPEPSESDTLLLKHTDDVRVEPIPEERRDGEDNASLYDNVEDRDWVCQPIKNAVLMYQNDVHSVDRRKPEEHPAVEVNPIATERRHPHHKLRNGADPSSHNIRVCPPVTDALILLKR